LSCWGGNEIGVNPRTLDRCSKKACVTRPVAIATDPKVAQVALGPNHGCLIRENGKVACWGSNLYGQVGVVKDTETSAVLSDVLEPTDVPLPGGATALLLSRFSDTSCAVLEDQSLYCWGHNDVGQLGIGNYPQTCALDADTSTPCATAPQKNAPQTNVQFSRYLKGINHNCALSVDVLYCWGADKDGQLGVDADRLEHCAPNLLCAKSPINIYSEIAVLDGVLGPNYTCVVVSDQQIQCAGWGFATAEAIAVNARVINCSKWCKVDLGWEATVEAIAITHLDRMCVLGNHGQVRCLTAYNPSAETLDTESIMVRQ
jgi:alpha-tubulin suppressor-like RCC1 family protein